jgi:hypothetical protein
MVEVRGVKVKSKAERANTGSAEGDCKVEYHHLRLKNWEDRVRKDDCKAKG